MTYRLRRNPLTPSTFSPKKVAAVGMRGYLLENWLRCVLVG